MDALEIRRAHFCGLSLGGATALGLAEQCPDRIDRVIVCDAPCASTPTSTKQWEERIVMAKGGGMAAMAEPIAFCIAGSAQYATAIKGMEISRSENSTWRAN